MPTCDDTITVRNMDDETRNICQLNGIVEKMLLYTMFCYFYAFSTHQPWKHAIDYQLYTLYTVQLYKYIFIILSSCPNGIRVLRLYKRRRLRPSEIKSIN